jgi:predicted DNA-binding transcriptional regulator AlpA
MMTRGDKLLTEAEAAEILGVKPGTLAIWRTNKRYNLPYCKVGSRVRYRACDIEEFVQRRLVGAQ